MRNPRPQGRFGAHGLLDPMVRLDVVDPRRIEGETTLEHVWNAWSYEHAPLLLREVVSRSGGDLPDTGKVTKSAGNGA